MKSDSWVSTIVPTSCKIGGTYWGMIRLKTWWKYLILLSPKSTYYSHNFMYLGIM